jgi:hypothetical protein
MTTLATPVSFADRIQWDKRIKPALILVVVAALGYAIGAYIVAPRAAAQLPTYLPAAYAALPNGLVLLTAEEGAGALLPVRIADTSTARDLGFRQVGEQAFTNTFMLYTLAREVTSRASYSVEGLRAPVEFAAIDASGTVLSITAAPVGGDPRLDRGPPPVAAGRPGGDAGALRRRAGQHDGPGRGRQVLNRGPHRSTLRRRTGRGAQPRPVRVHVPRRPGAGARAARPRRHRRARKGQPRAAGPTAAGTSSSSRRPERRGRRQIRAMGRPPAPLSTKPTQKRRRADRRARSANVSPATTRTPTRSRSVARRSRTPHVAAPARAQ